MLVERRDAKGVAPGVFDEHAGLHRRVDHLHRRQAGGIVGCGKFLQRVHDLMQIPRLLRAAIVHCGRQEVRDAFGDAHGGKPGLVVLAANPVAVRQRRVKEPVGRCSVRVAGCHRPGDVAVYMLRKSHRRGGEFLAHIVRAGDAKIRKPAHDGLPRFIRAQQAEAQVERATGDGVRVVVGVGKHAQRVGQPSAHHHDWTAVQPLV